MYNYVYIEFLGDIGSFVFVILLVEVKVQYASLLVTCQSGWTGTLSVSLVHTCCHKPNCQKHFPLEAGQMLFSSSLRTEVNSFNPVKRLSAFVLCHYAHKSVLFVTEMLTHLFRPWDAHTKNI